MAEAAKTAKRTLLFMPPKYIPFKIEDQVKDFASPQTARYSVPRRAAQGRLWDSPLPLSGTGQEFAKVNRPRLEPARIPMSYHHVRE
jgi:hypothetical protein